MPNSHSNLSGRSLAPIERPRCPKCHDRMDLARIMPGPKGYDLRNFECDKCDYVTTVTVVTDPMKSDAMGWLAGSLKPPA
jgi:predicted  nucleic acid-binding Zn ribbon protein